MPGFNTSTRKEDISMKLRAQHLKNARDQTKRLEEDNRKMEERLKELKTVMKREKELREKQGAGFWGKGQPNTGSLTNYASEVLQNKTVILPLEGKIKKVKVLRDEPLEKPKQAGPPGTMKYIAQRKLTTGTTPRDKQKGLKCGQCEDRAATVSCVQCSEIYCPGCFAAFHLKGALKQHRSVPLSAAGPRVCMSPSTSADSHTTRGGQASGLIPTQKNNSLNGSEAAGASSANQHTPISHSSPRTLLQGDYDESQSAASFQTALLAWRQGEQPKTRLSTEKQIVPPEVVDESIGTSEESKIPDIKFKSSLSYAEKLMVKKHLRMKLAEDSPEIDSNSKPNLTTQHELVHQSTQEPSMHPASRLHSPGSFLGGQTTSRSSYDTRNITVTTTNIRKTFTDFTRNLENNTGIENIATDSSWGQENGNSASIDEDEPVDFLSLLEAVKLSKSPDKIDARCMQKRSDISIIDLFPQEHSLSEVSGQRSSVAYIVKEVSPLESWKTEHLQLSEIPISTNDPDKHINSRLQNHHVYHHSPMGINSKLYNHAEKKDTTTSCASTIPQNQNYQSCKTISDLPPGGNKSLSNYDLRETYATSKHQFQETNNDLESHTSHVNLEVKSSKQLSGPKSNRPRPRSNLSNTGRLSSRTRCEEYFTKAPSESLKIVAQMAQCSGYPYSSQSQLEGFFLLGVDADQPVQMENRLMTPSQGRNMTPRSERQQKDTVKISNRLYQMSPRSWHPTNSLSPASLLDEVKVDEQRGGVTLSYSYSKQKSGQGFEWQPTSSQNLMDGSNGDPLPLFDASSTSISQRVSVQRSAGQGKGDIDSEPSRNIDTIPLSISHQTSQKAGSRRFNKIATPVSGHDIRSDFTIIPVPPDSKQGHRLSSEITSSISTKLNWVTNATNNGQNSFKSVEQSTEILETFKDEENLKQSRKMAISPTISATLKNSSFLKSEKHIPRLRQNQPSLSTDVSCDQVKTVHHHSNSSRTALVQNDSLNDLNKDFKNILSHRSDVKSAQRPNSSTTRPAQSGSHRFHTSAGTPRPNSSSGTMDPLRRTQPALPSAADNIVAVMLKSRVNEDGWVDEDVDFSHDYDDGDNLTPEALHLRLTPKLNNKKCEKWETEVRPFSGLSLGSRVDNSHTAAITAKRDNKKMSGPTSCRSVSAASCKSGRLSRAIVVDGDDLSCYDSIDTSLEQDLEDKQALDQLEWELASNTGRLTADGKVSRMSVHESNDVTKSQFLVTSVKMSSEKEYDIVARLLADEKQAERNVDIRELRMSMKDDEVDEVRALR